MLTKQMNPQKIKSLRRKLNCSLDMGEYRKYLLESGLSGFSDMDTDGLDLKIRISKYKYEIDEYLHHKSCKAT